MKNINIMSNNAIYFHRPGSVLSAKDSSMSEIWIEYLDGEMENLESPLRTDSHVFQWSH